MTMIWRQLSALLLLYVYVVGAFTTQSQRAINSRLFQSASTVAPPRKLAKQSKPASKSALASSTTSGGPVNNFLSNLPWVAKRETEREERALRMESAKLHRQLGLAEDATFEDINAVTEQLIAKTGGNIKEKVKIEIAKDRIMQLKLNARIKGLVRMDSQAQEAERLAEEERSGGDGDGDILSEKEKEEIDDYPFPEWSRGLIVPPDTQWRNRNLGLWSAVFFLGNVSAGLAAWSNIFSFLALTVGFLNRGYVRDDKAIEAQLEAEGSAPWRRRYMTGPHVKWGWMLGAGVSLLAKFLSVAGLPKFIRMGPYGVEAMRLFECTFLCLVASYVQLVKDPKKQPRRRPKDKKKRKPRRGGDGDD